MRTPFVLLLAASCGAAPLERTGMVTTYEPALHYEVHLDSSLTDAQEVDALQALDLWSHAVPVTWTVAIDACSVGTPAMICIRAGSDQETVGQPWLGLELVSGNLVVIASRNIEAATLGDVDSLTVQVMAHELGHAMMGPAHLGDGTLMCRDSGCAARLPTPADVAAWWGSIK